jgi:hypothetical protein
MEIIWLHSAQLGYVVRFASRYQFTQDSHAVAKFYNKIYGTNCLDEFELVLNRIKNSRILFCTASNWRCSSTVKEDCQTGHAYSTTGLMIALQ